MGEFDLKKLAHREIEYGKSFKCAGGTEQCDRGCEISLMIIEGKKYPFGGACNKYHNQIHHLSFDQTKFDKVKVRQTLVFETFAAGPDINPGGPTVGMNRSFLANMLSDEVDPEGIKHKRTTLCYPAEISHGCYYNLIKKNTDLIFLPKIIELSVTNSVSTKREHQCTCLLLQSEPYCLASAFKGVPVRGKIISRRPSTLRRGGIRREKYSRK
jgi:hypothetical protein